MRKNSPECMHLFMYTVACVFISNHDPKLMHSFWMVCELNQGQNNNKQVSRLETLEWSRQQTAKLLLSKTAKTTSPLTNCHLNFLRWVNSTVTRRESNSLALLYQRLPFLTEAWRSFRLPSCFVSYVHLTMVVVIQC